MSTVSVAPATLAGRIGAMCEASSAHRRGDRGAPRPGHGEERVAVLTGTLRDHERFALAGGAVWRRFCPERKRTRSRPAVYLVMMSADEVGVDLDVDHVVMDLVTFDSMVQRLGRINRAGLGSATVTVVHEGFDPEPAGRFGTAAGRLRAARRETLEVLRSLEDLAPGTLRHVDQETLARYSVSRVTIPQLGAAMVESYALTSADLVRPSKCTCAG